MRRRVHALAAMLVLSACSSPAPSSRPGDFRYVVGEPYSLGGVWSYPREDFGLAESGLAAVLLGRQRGARTANGELYDPSVPTAAHRTLQLPAVVRVWNLDSGRELRVRVNDRGPAQPGRVLGLSPRAAELLGAKQGEALRVRVAVDPEWSRAVMENLPGSEGPRLVIATAPVAAVEREQLVPLAGFRAVAGPMDSPRAVRYALPPALPAASPPRSPVRLPDEIVERGAVASRLLLDVGTFFRRDLAERRALAVGGTVQAAGSGRSAQFRVRAGPFATAGEADHALEAAFRRGIPDAMIILD